MPRITFINDDGAGFGSPREVPYGTTMAGLFREIWPTGNPEHFRFTLNGRSATGDDRLSDGDRVAMIAATDEARYPGYGQRLGGTVGGYGAVDRDGGDRVAFIAPHGTGFADWYYIRPGTTLEQFVYERLGRHFDVRNHVISVDGVQGPPASQVLRANNHISVTPRNIKAASDVEITLIKGSGAGYAARRRIPQGTTLGELFHRETEGDDPERTHIIKLNGETATRDRVLENGDSVTISPKNVKGA